MFSVRYELIFYVFNARVEAGSDSSTVAPAWCRRRRKGNPVPGGTTGPSCYWRK
jgi:hypothetical protein